MPTPRINWEINLPSLIALVGIVIGAASAWGNLQSTEVQQSKQIEENKAAIAGLVQERTDLRVQLATLATKLDSVTDELRLLRVGIEKVQEKRE